MRKAAQGMVHPRSPLSCRPRACFRVSARRPECRVWGGTPETIAAVYATLVWLAMSLGISAARVPGRMAYLLTFSLAFSLSIVSRVSAAGVQRLYS